MCLAAARPHSTAVLLIMFDDVISTGLQAVLAEVFESVDKRQLNVSLVGDIFKESHLELTDLRLKKTLLKDLNLPVEVKEGLVGKLVIQGLSGEYSRRQNRVAGGCKACMRECNLHLRCACVYFARWPQLFDERVSLSGTASGLSSSSSRVKCYHGMFVSFLFCRYFFETTSHSRQIVRDVMSCPVQSTQNKNNSPPLRNQPLYLSLLSIAALRGPGALYHLNHTLQTTAPLLRTDCRNSIHPVLMNL